MTPSGEPFGLTWARVDDGLVRGRLQRAKIRCDVCGGWCGGIAIEGYDLPEGIPWSITIIAIHPAPIVHSSGARVRGRPWVVVSLGIGGGCYAKFHRQVAHIKDKRERGI